MTVTSLLGLLDNFGMKIFNYFYCRTEEWKRQKEKKVCFGFLKLPSLGVQGKGIRNKAMNRERK